jgi:hypothetical protein
MFKRGGFNDNPNDSDLPAASYLLIYSEGLSPLWGHFSCPHAFSGLLQGSRGQAFAKASWAYDGNCAVPTSRPITCHPIRKERQFSRSASEDTPLKDWSRCIVSLGVMTD